MNTDKKPIRGRGASDNPVNRFEGNYVDYDLDEETGEKPSPKTQLIRDASKSLITYNKSPDIGFNASINPYRGCEHGCIYCYARPYHEYLGFSSGLDFESKIMVKYNAASILRKELRAEKWEPQVIAMSGVTDIYQPIEKKLGITRECLSVLAEFRNPVGLITKNHLVTRDVDLLAELSEYNCISVTISVTSLDKDLTGVMEPRTSRPNRRLEAIRKLSDAGIRVGVNIAPIIPGITDHEMVSILEHAKEAGADFAGYTIIRLPHKVKDIFVEWLEQHYPDRKNKVLNKVLDIRGGKLNNSKWGERMKGQGSYAAQIRDLFQVHTNRLELNKRNLQLSTDHFIKDTGEQLRLF
ncbi:PA0069 family radical SAM protein [Rhodohalobacter sp.]|uniref:PA0069 family radical SAM protein n=1 Tax=Rhodohalobacter sp. TaxID=1974210 RepID=UPI002ACEE505|nr:PA0069 family radical SAM protein [Rhodohalobacter sp.]MDZ7756387.1 PA0069 family radical SAM protein [Rhodohalobacter sp.]